MPYMVNANKTSLVGVRVEVVPECVCGARNFAKVRETSTIYIKSKCLNGRRVLFSVLKNGRVNHDISYTIGKSTNRRWFVIHNYGNYLITVLTTAVGK